MSKMDESMGKEDFMTSRVFQTGVLLTMLNYRDAEPTWGAEQI